MALRASSRSATAKYTFQWGGTSAGIIGGFAIIPPMEHLVQGDEVIEALVAQRNEARRNRDFALSDKIRQELLDRGVLIEDMREGTRWRRK